MESIDEFVKQTLKNNKNELQEIKELQKILKQLQPKRETILRSYATTSSTW